MSGADKIVLDNGATVVCKYIPDSPLVAIQVRVLSGLSNEGRYAGSGISHFLEHLIFKGTHSMTSEQVTREMKSLGGIVNGSTGLDSAEYSITVPRENFEKALDMIVGMVMEPVFTDEELSRERNVIIKEITMHKDDPASRLMELLFGQAYRESVYRNPIIGYKERLEALTRQDILEYHGAAYTADRIVVGIAGGVPAERAMAVAEEKLKTYERGSSWWAPDTRDEPHQLEARSVTFDSDTSLGYLAVGYHTTSLYSSGLYAGDVMSLLLGEGNDSRLYRRLVREKQLLYSVSSVNYTPRYPGLFIITGVGDPQKLEAARREITAVIEEMRTSRTLDAELEKSKNAVIADYYRSHEDVADVASSLTMSETMTGSPDFFEKYVKGIQDVRKEDIQGMISGYLREENSTTVVLLPRTAAGALLETEPEEQTDVGEERSVTLDNGLQVFVKRRPRLPLVSVTLVFAGGLRAENAEDNGLANLTTSMLLKGTKKLKEGDIVPALERLGASISSFSGMNSMGLNMDILARDYDKCMGVLESVVKDPSFPESELLKEKINIAAAIREQGDDIFESGMNTLRKAVYKDHPYAMNILGSADIVEEMTRDNVVEFYKGHFAPSNAALTIVGDIDVERTLADVSRKFGAWRGDPVVLDRREVRPIRGKETQDLYVPKQQSLLLIGFQGVTIEDDQQYVLSLISAILSGSDGLLFHSMRGADSLAYATGAASVPGVDKGYFALYVATTEENIELAKKKMFEAVAKVSGGDISDEDIAASRNRLLSQYASSVESNSSLALTAALDGLYGLGFEHYKDFPAKISGIRREDIKNCAKRFLTPEKCAIVTVHSGRR